MSNYINKSIANSISRSLTEKISKKISLKKINLESFVIEIYLKTIPEKVLQSFSEHPNYHLRASSIILEGNGLNDGIPLSKGVIANTNYSKVLLVENIDDAKKISKDLNEIKKLEDKYSVIKSEITTTLLSLRTFKKIAEEFPEAVPFFPTNNENINAVSIPIKDIRSQLKALNS